MKNNPFDGLNYEKPKYNPIEDFKKFYEQSGKSKPNNEPASDSVEFLRKKFDRDPESLSPIERLTLGFAELTKKNEKESLERQAKSFEEQQKLREQQEMISVKSKEFKTLADNIAALQVEFQRLNGGGE